MSNSELINSNFCNHSKLKQKYSKDITLNTYDYCENCGSIIIKYENKNYFTIKPKKHRKPVDLNPIKIILKMKNQQEIFFPYLNYNYNVKINKNDVFQNIELINNEINFYISKRYFLIYHLQNLTKILNYSDLSFYQTLIFLDLYIAHNICEEISDAELLGLLIGFFSISSKYKETDIYEPDLHLYCEYSENFNLTLLEIRSLEILCLKLINYNLNLYSTYDWLCIFTGIGYIFDCEIENEDTVEKMHENCLKLLVLITPKNIFIKYSPMKLALSIIKASRDNLISQNKINDNLYQNLLKLFNVQFKDYEDCYNELKIVIEKENGTSTYQTQANSNSNNTRHGPFIDTSKRIENDSSRVMKPKIQNYSQDKIVIKAEKTNKFQIKKISANKIIHPKTIETCNSDFNGKIINNNQINNITINITSDNKVNKYNNISSLNNKLKNENEITLDNNQYKNSSKFINKIGKVYKYNIKFLKQKKLAFNLNPNLKKSYISGPKICSKENSSKLKKILFNNNIIENSHRRFPRNAKLKNIYITNSKVFRTEHNNTNSDGITENNSTENLRNNNKINKNNNSNSNIFKKNLRFIDDPLLKRQKTLDNIPNVVLEPIKLNYPSKDKIVKNKEQIKYLLENENSHKLSLNKKKINFPKMRNNKSNINDLLSYRKFVENKKLPKLRLKNCEK